MGVVKLPDDYHNDDIIGAGTSGLIVLHRVENIAIKFPHEPDEVDPRTELRCIQEAEIYEKLEVDGRPKSLLGYLGRYADTKFKGIRLEYAPEGCITRTLMRSNPSNDLRMRWSLQGTFRYPPATNLFPSINMFIH